MYKYLGFLIILLCLACVSGHAQSFIKKSNFDLPDTATYESLSWADFNNDTLLDVLISGTDSKQENFFLIFKNIGEGNFEYGLSIQAALRNVAFELTDVNQDNQIDIISTGVGLNGSVVAFLNTGDLSFQRVDLVNSSGSLIKYHDLNNDGMPEVILSGVRSGSPFLEIYEGEDSNWVLVNDTITIQATGIQVFDFDGDSDKDLFVSGIDVHQNPIAQFFVNHGNYFFSSTTFSASVNGRSSVSDLNHDGQLDVILGGIDQNGNDKTILFLGNTSGFTAKDSLIALHDNQIFTGDFNSDGKCDINFLGTDAQSDTSNLILNANGTTEAVSHRNVKTQSFGDFDRDGDLDLGQLVVTEDKISLSIFENVNPEENKAPLRPFGVVSAYVIGRYFLYWEKPEDDHTATSSLTYDVSLMSPGQELLSGTFDLITGKRLLVNHGNSGTNNHILIRTPFASIDYRIQSVDNAYHADAKEICIGGGPPTACQEFVVETIQACKSETIELTGSEQTLWVSFTKGLVHKGASYSFLAAQSDTVFSVTPRGDGLCDVVTLYNLDVKDTLTKSVREVRHICDGSTVVLDAGQGWEQVLWSSDKRGVLSSEDRIQYRASEDDIVTLTTSDGSGCNLERITELIISKPSLQVGDSAYQILRGEVVQLNASGGDVYSWTPSAGLDNPGIANPMASPVSTTTYNVTATDSIGCVASKRILVIVEKSAFIPTLFTPNADGRNDELRVYGLDNARGFNLSIYNREGSLVYSSGSVSEVTGRGWDGVSNGRAQPSGVYYWKVKGESNTGEKILLNGKNAGSIVLIR